MARTPRRQAKSGKAARADKAAGRRRGVSALAVVVFLLAAGAGAGVAWLSLTYEAPSLPGMPGNDVVLVLGDHDKAVGKPVHEMPAKPPASGHDDTAQADASHGDDGHTASDDKAQDTAHGDTAAPDEPAKPAADQGADQAPAPQDQASQDHAAADDKPADGRAADAAPANHGATAPQQHAAAPATGDHGTTPPAPAGQPQRQPVGEKTAMQLKVPPPSPGVKPRIAIVLTRLGLSNAQTTAAVQALPANITFAFSPYGNDLQNWADQARAAGHEVLLELPMEPLDFPNDDPGPHTLLTSLPATENVERMNWVLDRFTGYVGVTSQIGGRFTTQPEALTPILTELKKRGLLFLDTRTTPDTVAPELAASAGLAHASNDVFLNEPTAARATLQAGLAELERLARERGSAIGIGYPFPVTMELLSGWARSLEERGIELLPVSALARLPEAQ